MLTLLQIIGVTLLLAITTAAPSTAYAQCVGPERVGKTLGLYLNDNRGEGVVTSPLSGRVAIRRPSHIVLGDRTPAQFDELVDCDGSTYVVYVRETSPTGRVLAWFSIVWLMLLIGGAAGTAAGVAMGRRRLMRKGEESAAFPIGGAVLGALMAAFGYNLPVWVISPGGVTTTPPPRPTETYAGSERAADDDMEIDCAETAMCRRNGACAFIDGACTPGSEEHCSQSERCTSEATCSFVEGECVVTEDDCRAWDKCASEALCTLDNGQCIRTEEDCANSAQCAEVGNCSLIDGKCLPGTDDDCQRAEVCKKLKRKDRKKCGLVENPFLGKVECKLKTVDTELQRTVHDLDPLSLPKHLPGNIPGFGGN